MSARRLFAVAVATYSLGLLGWSLWPAFRESFIGKIVGVPLFSIYIFEHLGVPGLTNRNSCDWMWCKPTMLGTIFTTAVWLGAAWLAASGRARLSRFARMPTGGRSAPPAAKRKR
jgi:hypothetical protein